MQSLILIALLGGLQGGIILLSILFRYRHWKNLPLALLLVVFSLRLATIPTWNPETLILYPWIYPLTAPLPFLFAPLLWMYIRVLGTDTLKLPRPLIIHFVPYILELAAVIFTLIMMRSGEYAEFVHNVFSGNPPLWLPVRNGLKVALNITYLVLSGRIAFSKKSKQLSALKSLYLKLLVIIPSIVLFAFAYVALPPYVTHNLSDGTIMPFFILSVCMAVLIYSISFLLMAAPEISIFPIKNKAGIGDQVCSDIECRKIIAMVEKRVEEGGFHNPDLLLTDLAAELNIHPNRLSYAVNHYFCISFRTYLNRKRLDYFISQINSDSLRSRSILEIAFEAGFPSKSTFNRVFKEEMEITPSEYVNKSGA